MRLKTRGFSKFWKFPVFSIGNPIVMKINGKSGYFQENLVKHLSSVTKLACPGADFFLNMVDFGENPKNRFGVSNRHENLQGHHHKHS